MRIRPPAVATSSPAITASDVSLSVSACDRISPVPASTLTCNFLQSRRFSPCFLRAHSPTARQAIAQHIAERGPVEFEAGRVQHKIDGCHVRPGACMPMGTVRRRLASVVWSGTGRSSFIRAKIDRVNPSACRSGRSKAAARSSTVSIARSDYRACRPRVRRRGGDPSGEGVVIGDLETAHPRAQPDRGHTRTSWSRGTLPSGSGGGGVR